MSEKWEEIEGYIYEYHREWILQGVSMPFLPANGKHGNGGPKIKCILKIPVEEKKIVITESEFQKILDLTTFDSWQEFEDKIKQKLFSKQVCDQTASKERE